MVVREQKTGVDLAVELCGLMLRTPLIPASGTLSREALGEVEGVYGAMLPKTATPVARAGNPPPRVAETPAGMVNSIGLQNPGIERFLQGLDAFDLGVPILVSVAGDTVAEFAWLCEILAGDARISAVELNLSCPNVECGGLAFAPDPPLSRRLSRPVAPPSLVNSSSPSSQTKVSWRTLAPPNRLALTRSPS